MTKFTGLSLFTGGGLCDIGLRGIVDFIGGVEYDPAIAAHASMALGHTVTCASVVDVDYRQWLGVDYLHMSPPCTNASVANANAGETDNDKALSGACCRAIREIRPRFVTLENVAGYAQFSAFQDILECLASEGYAVHWRVYDAADFGVPQHRKRIMLRARRDGKPLPEVLPTHGSPKDVEASRVQGKLFEEPLPPWVGWYQAIADLLPSCPDTALAPWQVKRLTAQYGEEWLDNLLVRYAGQDSEVGGTPTSPCPSLTADGCTKSRAVLVGAQGYKGEVQNTAGDEPAPTPNTTSGAGAYRAILVEGQSKGKRPPSLTEPGKDSPAQAGTGGGNVNRAILTDAHRVVALTPRCLARFQSVPDDYPLPEKKSLATKIIGNGVPSQMARAIFGSMLGGTAMTSTTLPPPPPSMVYANVLEYPKHRGRVTPQTWLMALEQLQDTREARAAMRDVWDWEQAGCPLPEEREPEQIALDARNCEQCGTSFVPSVSRQVYCTSQCRNTYYRPSRAERTETAFCANPECGLGFDRTNPKKAYCCERCSSRAAYLIRKTKEARQ